MFTKGLPDRIPKGYRARNDCAGIFKLKSGNEILSYDGVFSVIGTCPHGGCGENELNLFNGEVAYLVNVNVYYHIQVRIAYQLSFHQNFIQYETLHLNNLIL